MLLSLSDLSPEPLYGQILRQVRSLILKGELREAEAIPSIRDLARTHKVSVITVQKAYDELVREGLIVARRGKGYFVSEIKEADRTELGRSNRKEKLKIPIVSALDDGMSRETIHLIVDEIIEEHLNAKS